MPHLIFLTSYINPIDAHITKGRLECEGIPTFIVDEHLIWAYWTRSLLFGGVKIKVSVNNISKAKEILKSIERGDYCLTDQIEDVLSCPKCKGTNVEESFNMLISLASFLLCFFNGVYFPSKKNICRCVSCSYSWKDRTNKSSKSDAASVAPS